MQLKFEDACFGMWDTKVRSLQKSERHRLQTKARDSHSQTQRQDQVPSEARVTKIGEQGSKP